MDIYEARRLVVEDIIKRVFNGNQSKFAEATGVSPSYVTRMLKKIGEASKKRISTGMAVRLEAVEALGLQPGALLNPILRSRNEPPTDTTERPDIEVRRGDGATFSIEVRKSSLTDSTLSFDELEDFVRAIFDIPPKKARETLLTLMEEAEEYRQYAKAYMARVGVKTDPTAAHGAYIPPAPKAKRVADPLTSAFDAPASGKSRGTVVQDGAGKKPGRRKVKQ